MCPLGMPTTIVAIEHSITIDLWQILAKDVAQEVQH